MNQTSLYRAQGPQRRERLFDLASLRKKPAQDDAMQTAHETSDGDVKAPADAMATEDVG